MVGRLKIDEKLFELQLNGTEITWLLWNIHHLSSRFCENRIHLLEGGLSINCVGYSTGLDYFAPPLTIKEEAEDFLFIWSLFLSSPPEV